MRKIFFPYSRPIFTSFPLFKKRAPEIIKKTGTLQRTSDSYILTTAQSEEEYEFKNNGAAVCSTTTAKAAITRRLSNAIILLLDISIILN